MNALQIAATGMSAQEQNVNVISNNIANINTTAYKRQRASFQDLLYQNGATAGATTSSAGTMAPTGLQSGLGVRVGSTYKIFEQGPVAKTGSSLDISIQGRGLFKISMPDGSTSFTRDGHFNRDNAGNMVNSQGFTLDPAINIPIDMVDLSISAAGNVSGKVNENTVDLGQITVSMFVNEAGLKNIGDNLYRATDASGAATDVVSGEEGSGALLQSHLESSNVDAVQETTDLIKAQRAYELNSRVIATADQMLNAVNQIR
jgi:flagellar basal-body rod protein FlgG